MRTQALQTLATIDRIGSFAKAATELNSTLSTVSMQMKNLEEELGINLFDRNFRPPALTPRGRMIAKHAHRMLAVEQDILHAVGGESELAGLYRLGLVATASVRLLPLFLKNAKSAAPNSEFQIETALSQVLEARVISGQLDAAVVTASANPPPELEYLRLREEALKFAIPQSYQSEPVENLAQSIAFLQFNPGSGIGKLIEAYMHTHISDISETIILDSVEAIMECVNEGLGFTLLAEADVRRYGKGGTVIRQPNKDKPSRDLVLATSKRNRDSSFKEVIASLFNGD